MVGWKVINIGKAFNKHVEDKLVTMKSVLIKVKISQIIVCTLSVGVETNIGTDE